MLDGIAEVWWVEFTDLLQNSETVAILLGGGFKELDRDSVERNGSVGFGDVFDIVVEGWAVKEASGYENGYGGEFVRVVMED